MRKFPHAFICTPALALASVLVMPAAASAMAIYSENFNSGTVGSEWSTNSGTLAVDTAANSPNEMYLGLNDTFQFGLANQSVFLNLSGLAAHTQVTLTFDMIIMRSMDGNEPFTLSAVGPGTLASESFENLTSGGNPLGGSDNANGSGVFGHADAENSLGVTPDTNVGSIETALYRRSFTFDHSTSDLAITFSYSGLSSITDESWAIDNVLVESNAQSTAASAPATLPLVAAGLLGAAFVRRQRRKA